MKTKKILLLYNLLFLSFSLLLGQGKTPCDLFAQLNKDLTEVPKLFSVLEVPANKKAYDLLKNASQDFRRNEDNIKKLVDDLASSSSGFEDIINTDGGIKAWEGLINVSERTKVHSLETVAKHYDETGKIPKKIEDEIAQSGSYEKWLSDYFVTYEKSGYILNKVSIDMQFANHLNKVDGQISANNVPGCHNRVEFFKEVYDPVTAPNKRVVIINEIPKVQNGWTEIEYRTYKVDLQGNLVFPLEFNSGIQGFKTVYNPNLISASAIKEAGYNSFRNAIDNPATNIGYIQNQPNSFFGLSNGIEFRGFLESNQIKTWFIK